MIKISVIISFRDRDTARLKYCLDSLKNQSFIDFEVIFIDYGSEQEYVIQARTLVTSYSFCSYYYVYSQGLPWNRAHAINIGIRLAKADYLLITDIDVIHSNNHLEVLFKERKINTSIYNPVYWLKEQFSNYNSIIEGSYIIQKNDYSTISKAKGTSHFISKDVMLEIGGYDEFFCFWGVEDRDLGSRLRKKGIKEHWLDIGLSPMFHQWHPTVTHEKDSFFPDKWWDDMNIYYQLNIDKIKRNNDDWGQFINILDRPILKLNEKIFEFEIDKTGTFDKVRVICRIIDELDKLNENECLVINIPNEQIKPRIDKIVSFVNIFLEKKLPYLRLDYINRIDRDRYFLPKRDIFYLIWQLYRIEKKISDIYLNFSNNQQQIKISNNKKVSFTNTHD